MDSSFECVEDHRGTSEAAFQSADFGLTFGGESLFKDPADLTDFVDVPGHDESEHGSLPSFDVERFNLDAQVSEHSGTFERDVERSICPSPSTAVADEPSDVVPLHGVAEPVARDSQWMLGVVAGHSQFSQSSSSLRLPWETGVFAEIFGTGNLLELPYSQLPEPDSALMERVITVAESLDQTASMPSDSCFDKAVHNIHDLEYFENKHRQLELACGQWLELLSCNWYASGVGEQVAQDMQKDASGVSANETLKASFGVKSPQTLLKRAASLRRYFKWHQEHRADAEYAPASPLPLSEPDVWEFFLWLKAYRQESGRGFTNPAAFLETVRFSKFCLNLYQTDSVLQSRRLLGFAAIEKLQKGPNQAPPLELVHLQKLHSILETAACLHDRLGAGVMLICVYGRARWSDLRFVHHAQIEHGRSGFLTLYTAEHKTSAVGARREQYLPLVVPWTGVTHHEWIVTFLQVYMESGLDIHKVPLGPLLPAPKLGGGFSARPLTTTEAASWLRLLLRDTPNCETYRAHSLKTTLLVWAAKAGLDKEVRAVLGHHASALEGSEVVYSRFLQTRALRKLNMLLHRVRIGLGIEEDPMAPNPFATPAMRTPAPAAGPAPCTPFPPVPPLPDGTIEPEHVIDQAAEEVNVANDVESVKEELLDERQIAAAADQVSLFDLQLVGQGIVEIDSSSGSDSSSDSESTSSDGPVVHQPDANAFSETVPEGVEYYKHRKSSIVHKVKPGSASAACGAVLSSNLQLMPRVLRVRWPKCLKCFPKDSSRIRNVDQMVGALDAVLQRNKRAAK
eukprot:s116_g31.t1